MPPGVKSVRHRATEGADAATVAAELLAPGVGAPSARHLRAQSASPQHSADHASYRCSHSCLTRASLLWSTACERARGAAECGEWRTRGCAGVMQPRRNSVPPIHRCGTTTRTSPATATPTPSWGHRRRANSGWCSWVTRSPRAGRSISRRCFPGKPYIGRGIGGQTTPQMLVRFSRRCCRAPSPRWW